MNEPESKSRVIQTNNAGVLLNMAHLLSQQAGQNPLEPQYAVAAVLMSCAAAEAHLNELVMLLVEMPNMAGSEKRIQQLVMTVNKMISTEASVRTKYKTAYKIVTGKAFKDTGLLYECFTLLFDVRNEVMHYKLEAYNVGEIHPIIVRLKAAQLCNDGDLVWPTWLAQMANPVVADWAVKTAAWTMTTINQAVFDVVKGNPDAMQLQMLAGFGFIGEAETGLNANPEPPK